MSSGDDIQAGRITTAESTTDLVGAIPSERDVDFNGNVILRVGPQRGELGPNHTLDGIHGLASNGPVPSPGGAGVVGFGGPNHGTGVVGLGGASGGSSGGQGSGGTGVFGKGGDGISFGFEGPINPGTGVHGQGGEPDPLADPPMSGGIGVLGVAGGPTDGVIGVSNAVDHNGVFGFNTSGNGVGGVSGAAGKSGVFGFNAAGDGVVGMSGMFGNGIAGFNLGSGRGIYGESRDGVGVMGLARKGSRSGLAGFFQGRVAIVGSFVVFGGTKSCAVPHVDGSHRLLYCVESPENWFEDFGEAKLVDGKATVRLEAEFAALIKADSYHVFLSAYGDSNGLYVSRRSTSEFDVHEHRGGKSHLSFSYRIVAKRKDLDGVRLAKTSQPVFPDVAQPVPRDVSRSDVLPTT